MSDRRRPVLWGVSAVAVVALVVAIVASGRSPKEKLAVPRAPLVAATNGKIAFIRSSEPGDHRTSKIFVMNGDGSNQMLLAETTQGRDLAWSPDGRKLAFVDVGGIYTVNADGTGETRILTGDDQAGRPTWSPEGTRLAFPSFNRARGGIYVANLDGTNRKQLTSGPSDGAPAWSPDGTRIAFAREGGISVMNADGSAPTRLTATHSDSAHYMRPDAGPTWSPDSRQIAFLHSTDISVIDADGGAARALASPGGTGAVSSGGAGANKLAVGRGEPSHPTWSPDGTRIAYAVIQSGTSCSVWAMNADGSSAKTLTDGVQCDDDPAWQPIPRP